VGIVFAASFVLMWGLYDFPSPDPVVISFRVFLSVISAFAVTCAVSVLAIGITALFSWLMDGVF
jgi:hypothetical protein